MEDDQAASATAGPRVKPVCGDLLFDDNGSGVSKVVLFVLLLL